MAFIVSYATIAYALDLPGAVVPGRDRPPASVPTQPEVDFRLESPQRSPIPRAADTVHFRLNDIRVVGARVLPAESFRDVYENLIGKDITLSNILDVADKIEARYRAAGYLLVRAYVPPQRVKDGVFTINVVEGFVASTSVEGASKATRAVTKNYLREVVDQKPLELSTIERALLLANDIPGVTATGTLRAASTPGASELIVNESESPIAAGLATNNRGSRFSGRWTLSADVALNDLLGGDQIALAGNTSPDAKEQVSGQLIYRKAIGSDGLIGSLYGVYTHGQPGSTLAVAGVLTDSWAAGLHAAYPLIRSRALSILLQGGLSAQSATIHASGLAISHDQWRVVDIGVTALQSGFLDANWKGGIDVAQGLPIFGATPNDSPLLSRPGAKLDFTKIDGDLQVVRPIAYSVSAALGGFGQFSFAHLINGEEVSYGGTQIVRGFDPGSITGDSGVGGFIELRYDGHFPEHLLNTVEPYVFVAGAEAWYVHAAAHGLMNERISSAGCGVRVWLPHNITGDVEVTRMLDAVPGSDAGRQATKVLIDAAINF
jgi:hemolysin activation/secretion protein